MSPARMNASAAIYPAWLRANPRFPGTVFMYGTWNCPGNRDLSGQYGKRGCPLWLMRSIDGGRHWVDMRPELSTVATFAGPYPGIFESQNQGFSFTPVFYSPDGRRSYLSVVDIVSPGSQRYTIPWSNDSGAHWNTGRFTSPCGQAVGLTLPALSPVSGTRLYAWEEAGFNAIGALEYSNDGGRTWPGCHDLSDLGNSGLSVELSEQVLGPLVADPRHLNTVYSNMYTVAEAQPEVFQAVIRSDDAGAHWTAVISPTASPPLQSFKVGVDPHEGRLLVGYPGGPGVPGDRIYLSKDEGNTWHAATCPGDLHGQCPSFTVDNVFGAGASYAFVGDGVYRFHGGGRAEKRLPLSATLPFRVADLLDVSAGTRFGDPIYVLANGTRGALRARLWRGTDGGRHWQELLRGAFPVHRLTK